MKNRKIEMKEKVLDVLARLSAQAAARLIPLEAYLEQFVEPGRAALNGSVTLEEFDAVLDQLAGPTKVPSLPADFSRADIYADHN